MNNHLSTLIAFVGFLSLFSMLTQSVQEAVKNLIKIKARVWQSFIKDLYEREFGLRSISTPSDGPLKRMITSLKSVYYPIRSIWSAETFGDFDVRLAQLKTASSEACKSFQELSSRLDAMDEVIAGGTNDAAFSTYLKALIEKGREIGGLRLPALLEIYDCYQDKAITNFTKAFTDLDTVYLADDPAKDPLEKKKELVAAVASLRGPVKQVEKALFIFRTQIDMKIESWTKQCEAHYRRNMLKWTVIIGFALVFGFNADAFNMYRYFSVDSTRHAENITKKMEETNMKVPPSFFKEYEGAREKLDKEVSVRAWAEAKKALVSAAAAMEKNVGVIGNNVRIASVKEIGEAANQLDIAKTDDIDKRISALRDRLGVEHAYLTKAIADYRFEEMGALELPLGWTQDWPTVKAAYLSGDAKVISSKFGGLLLTGLLITFGAPFWNDLLNALLGFKKKIGS